MSEPLVSVIVAARNADAYVARAISSILTQTYEHLELVVVDDASTDETGAILRETEARDERVRILRNDERLGLAASLNRAIQHAHGVLLARMDADDIALPERIARQVAVFGEDPGLVLLGSNVEHVDADGNAIGVTQLPLDDWTIRCVAVSLNPFAHPSVMIRAEALHEEGKAYDTSFETTQDWELWTRLMARGRVANIRTPLVRQRLHQGSVSATKGETQLANSLRVQERYVRDFLGPEAFDPVQFSRLNRVFYGDRHAADLSGNDRVAACRDALALLDTVMQRYPSRGSKVYESFVVQRCLRMGVAPPFRDGALKLAFFLASRHPGSVLASILQVTSDRVRRKVGLLGCGYGEFVYRRRA